MLGTIVDLSGPVASVGVAVRNGLQMRVDEANAAGGINGRKIRLLVEDNSYDPKRSVLAAQKLVLNEKVFAIVGHIGTAHNEAVLPFLIENNVINFAPQSGGKPMFDPPDRMKVAIIQPNLATSETGTRYLVQQKKHTKVCVFYQDDDFGMDYLKGAENALKSMNMALTEKVSYKRGATDYSSQVTRLKSAGCQLVVIGGIIRETVGVMNEANKQEFTPDFVGGESSYSILVTQLGGKAVENLYAAHNMPNFYADDPDKKVRDWVNAYKTRFNIDPVVSTAYAYYAMDVFIAAATKAGANLTTDAFLNTMETTAFPGFMGGPSFKVTKTNRLGTSQLRVSQVRNGRWVQASDWLTVQR
ncbi:MAG: ABC transporter substrate-binding protein [Burkholderiales bacterium]